MAHRSSTSRTPASKTAHVLVLLPFVLLSFSGCKTTQPDSNQRLAQLTAELEETNQKVEEMYHRLSVVQFMAESHERMLTGKDPSLKTQGAAKASDDGEAVIDTAKVASVKEETLLADPQGAPPAAPEEAVSVGADEGSDEASTVEVEVPVTADEAVAASESHAEAPAPHAKTEIPTPSVTVKGKSPKDIYALGFTALKAKDYPSAAAYFRALVTAYPTHDLADNAVYWTGEIFYDQKDYKEAIRIFNRLVETYPGGGKVPDALLKIGFSYHSMKDRKNAVTYLKKVVVEYPFTDPGSKAEAMLNKIEQAH